MEMKRHMPDDVTKLQQALLICGNDPGEVDGLLGPNTKKALQKFQQSNGLMADGVLGPMAKNTLAVRLGEEADKINDLKGHYE